MDSSFATSTSTSTVRTLHQSMQAIEATAAAAVVSQPSSPRSSALPSPPDSPSSDSISSFPSGSISSSIFFSSAAGSPSQNHTHTTSNGTRDIGLIIPSLTLPAALRRPTPYGQTIGDVRLLVLGSKGSGKSYLSRFLLEENEDVVDIGSWEEAEYGTILRASTDWLEHKDPFGLDKFEPARNVEIIKLPGYDHTDDVHELLNTILDVIHDPFHAVADVLNPNEIDSPIVANLVSAPTSPLYTALVFLIPSSASSLEQQLIEELGSQIPIIRIAKHRHSTESRALSSVRPNSPLALRTLLFRNPDSLATLRSEAADRFIRWHTAGAIVDNIRRPSAPLDSSKSELSTHTIHRSAEAWNKTDWEAEWHQHQDQSADELSHDVARRLNAQRRRAAAATTTADVFPDEKAKPDCSGFDLDPLHLPSLLALSFSVLMPLARACVKPALLIIGGFCVGVRVGIFLRQ